jgi:putative colanic acid biosysnthesis UDP-glucose lipid carrier transferase
MSLFKRTFDLVIASLVIVCILSWLLPIMSLLIKVDSPGPVFFVQKRVGKGEKLFACFKLRSMIVNDEADWTPVTGHDHRITRLGAWLRRLHLDELPQFFNVFLGSMSLVGPRPYMPADSRRFAAVVPGDAALRHLVRPGITGMAQAKGLHGVYCNHHILLQRYYWDAWYVRNAGMGVDLLIIIRTMARLMRPYAKEGLRMMAPANRSISSNWGLHWSRKKSTPAASNSPILSATRAGVPASPERRPRLETE